MWYAIVVAVLTFAAGFVAGMLAERRIQREAAPEPYRIGVKDVSSDV